MKLGMLIGVCAVLTGFISLSIGHNPIYEIIVFGVLLTSFSFLLKKVDKLQAGSSRH